MPRVNLVKDSFPKQLLSEEWPLPCCQFLKTMILEFWHAAYTAEGGLLKIEADRDGSRWADNTDLRRDLRICISPFASNDDDSSQSHTRRSNDLEGMP